MIRKLFKAALLIVMIAVTVGWNFNQSKKGKPMSELALANIEALANNEVTANCGNMTPVLCKAICSWCGATYTTSQAPGSASNVQGSCTICGHSVKAY